MVTINGAEIYYELYGADNKKSILFLHGGPGMGDCRGDVALFKPLESEFKLLFVDLRGSGRSSLTPPYSHKQWVEDIEELRKHFNLEELVIFGSSYGGFLAQEYAIAYPEHVEYLILNVTSPDNSNEKLAIENARNANIDITEEELHRLFEGYVESNEDFKYLYKKIQPLYMKNFDPIKAEERLHSIYFHHETHNQAFRQIEHFDVKGELSKITANVLITSGEVDWITPAESGKIIHECIPNSIIIVFAGYSHSFVREVPEAYLEIFKNFINNRFENKRQHLLWEDGELTHV